MRSSLEGFYPCKVDLLLMLLYSYLVGVLEGELIILNGFRALSLCSFCTVISPEGLPLKIVFKVLLFALLALVMMLSSSDTRLVRGTMSYF
jgi:hypothetical protein